MKIALQREVISTTRKLRDVHVEVHAEGHELDSPSLDYGLEVLTMH